MNRALLNPDTMHGFSYTEVYYISTTPEMNSLTDILSLERFHLMVIKLISASILCNNVTPLGLIAKYVSQQQEYHHPHKM